MVFDEADCLENKLQGVLSLHVNLDNIKKENKNL